MKYNYTIIGAGIVGLATAIYLNKLQRSAKILILEKENRLGVHQTGNNSGVIHSGIYYKPGSLKAKNCRRGYKLLLDYCDKNNINYEICGKIILATNQFEEKSLNTILERGIANGLVGLKILDREEILEVEPNAIGNKAIYVPQTGIIDFKEVLKKYSMTNQENGCNILFNQDVIDLKEKNDFVEVRTKKEVFQSKFVITCAGLQSDRLASKTDENNDIRIIPFKGEYFKMKEDRKYLVNNLIYPVPDPSFPFLGVHFTRKINGEIEAGPNAVLSFKREGYTKLAFNLKDTIETITWPGFRKVARKYWRTGFREFYRSFNKKEFADSLSRLVPGIETSDLVKGGIGVRAQACDRNGNLIDDFIIKNSNRILHVCNAPSPAATASLAIGEHIANLVNS